ncbi:MAG: hypothetical protein M3334_02190 [Actinomycetota bacterium]|nr:hypothetical protein [Actinomycetota bacterium]MDQ5817172.1 hypothetical protein [Actinomycetota bacterium]
MDQAMVRHVGLVLLNFVVLQMMRRSEEESLGSVKEHWQLKVQTPPEISRRITGATLAENPATFVA